ncbi:MAG: tRNA (adenosine(37)-N6)-threonylcarbamoyltransferase complex transferase subunit TsaD [Ignavibacteria bacterium]|nr:tRNA (adenosine(37)-N6)-threonylcarbamoyltransferase complex transferase subunit TsaD [Ignavibacteria bacterium]
MKVLGIETSCDETSASIVENGITKSNVISSQAIHNIFGGVVPEVASRIHIQIISQVVSEALQKAGAKIQELDGIAVTNRPGLIGSLIVGINYAKGLALRYNLPIVPIDHIEGHIYSGFLEGIPLEFPFVTLVVSGGHTTLYYVRSFVDYEILGATRDDAAGEAFDKIGKLLGLGYPAGPIIDKLAKTGNANKFSFPRGLINSNDFDFSFSGLKTSVRYFIQKNYKNPQEIEKDLPDICASVQEAIVEVLTVKSFRAMESTNASTLVIAGGVSANSRLRELAMLEAEGRGLQLVVPRLQYCMDNAAMIALLGEVKLKNTPKELFYNYLFNANPTPIRAKLD